MRGIDRICAEDESKSILALGSSLHHKLPITQRESVSGPFAASPPLMTGIDRICAEHESKSILALERFQERVKKLWQLGCMRVQA
jgi:hypothetical protein